MCCKFHGRCLAGVWYWRRGRQRGAASVGKTSRRQYFNYSSSSIGQQIAGFLLHYCCARTSKSGPSRGLCAPAVQTCSILLHCFSSAPFVSCEMYGNRCCCCCCCFCCCCYCPCVLLLLLNNPVGQQRSQYVNKSSRVYRLD